MGPLTSDADAFMLVDALQAQEPGWRFGLLGGDQQDGRQVWWSAEFFGHVDPSKNYGQRHGESGHVSDRRRAIVLAALRAKGVENVGYSDLSVFLRTMFAMPYSRYEIGF